MAFDPNTVFNKKIEGDVLEELKRREGLVAGTTRDEDFKKWNYKKYAYVSITSKGENALELICSQKNTIGDGTINEQAGLDLYEDEGGIRRNLPILKSVTVTADGGSSPTNATMWTCKASFDVFTLDQLDKAEQSFLRVGSIVRMDGGWRGEASSANSGFVEGQVTNYNFSANKDGSFSCDFEFVGATSAFSGDNLDGSSATVEEVISDQPEDAKDAANLPPYPNLPRTLLIQHREAFGLKNRVKFSDAEAADGQIALKGENNEFALANIQESGGLFTKVAAYFNIDINDLFVPYVTLGKVVDEINKINTKSSKKEGSTTPKVTIICNKDTTIGSFVPEMFSADPTSILFGGEMANYGKEGQANKMFFGAGLTEFKSETNADLSKIYIALPTLNKIFSDLKLRDTGTYTEDDLKDAQTAPAVKDFLNEIFKTIQQMSGGLYDLITFQEPYGDPLKSELQIINKRKAYDGGAEDSPVIFQVIGEKSIIRDMSLSTEFNAKLQAAASTAARGGGQSTDVPAKLFTSLYADCKINAEDFIKDSELVTTEMMTAAKEKYGEGFDETMVEANTASLRKYLIQNTPANVKNEFGSLPYFINLSVTLDGIFGIPYFGRFTVDRLPETYKKKLFFTVTKINHSFDGQGDWSTTIDGTMNVKLG